MEVTRIKRNLSNFSILERADLSLVARAEVNKPSLPDRLSAAEFERRAEAALATLTWLAGCAPSDRMEFAPGVSMAVVMKVVYRFEQKHQVVS